MAKPREAGTANRIARDVGKLLMERIAEAYQEHGMDVPKRFRGSSFKFQTAVKNLKDSQVDIDSLAFGRWRMQRAAGSSSSGEKRAAPPPEPAAVSPRKSPRPLGAPAPIDADTSDCESPDDLFGSDEEAAAVKPAAKPAVIDLGSDSD